LILSDGSQLDDLEYHAWPETFGNTSGPWNGIGGSAMCTFTMEAYAGIERVLVFCGGRQVRVIDRRAFGAPQPNWESSR
jgi:hypothetical protein